MVVGRVERKLLGLTCVLNKILKLHGENGIRRQTQIQ